MLIPTPYQVSAEGGESGDPKGDTRPEDELDAVFRETETLLPKGKGTGEALHGKKEGRFRRSGGEVFQERKNTVIERLGPAKRGCRRV